MYPEALFGAAGITSGSPPRIIKPEDGIIDLAGFKKDRSYLYQSRWRPDLRLAYILPHCTRPERVGKITPVPLQGRRLNFS